MAESAARQYEVQFRCTVCWDSLKEPVTIPCGHSYCMSCITDCWGQKEQGPPYRCPQCRESFSQRPLLKKNTLIAEMMETLQKTSLQTAAVECDVCTSTNNHKGHSVVSVGSELTSKKKELKEINISCQKLIQERERGQQELNEAVKSFKSSALETMEDIEKVFTELICSLEKKRSEIKEQIRAQEKTEIDRAEELHKHLDQELTELRKTQVEIDKLLISDDQVKCLKSCQSVCVLPTFEDFPSFTQRTLLSFKDISISAFKEVLEDVCQQQTAKISREVANVYVIKPPEPKTQNDFLQYFSELHLDLNTAHQNLKLSEDSRKISGSEKAQHYPDHPKRFKEFHYILCEEGLCGRCYWEIECSGNKWAVAVCYKGIRRKGKNDECKLGYNKISWRLSPSQGKVCFIHNNKKVSIPAVCSSRIGVYLNHRAGTLSFYSVSDTMTLLHRVQTTFTEPLYHAFYTGKGSFVRIMKQRRVQTDNK